MKYNISKGAFSSGIHFGLHTGRVSQTYRVRFDSSCLYTDIDWEKDYNKLIGWSYSNIPTKKTPQQSAKKDFTLFGTDYIVGHHINSVRLVFRPNKEKGVIESAFYYYQDGIRTVVELCDLPVDQDLILSITLKEQFATCVMVCKKTNLSFVKPITLPHAFKAIWSYKLYPVFGGSNPAPQDISLSVTEV